MSAGTPLTDGDRQPWLEIVRKSAVETCEKQAQVHEAVEGSEKGGEGGEEGPKAHGVVVGCSALKKKYRDVLRGFPRSTECACQQYNGNHICIVCPCGPGGCNNFVLRTYFVYIKGARTELLQRMENRKDHFMKASMLDSQLRDLESPDEDGEKRVVVVPLDVSTEEQVRIAKEGLVKLGALRSE